jgi:hypothetical protein
MVVSESDGAEPAGSGRAGAGEGDDPVAPLEAAGRRLVLVTAGGGAAAIARLATTPGGSGVLLEATVASARQAVDGLLGGPQESYCSSRAARRLAVASWQRARRLGAEPAAAMGVAVTAALVTRGPKRGPHRLHVAVQTLGESLVASLVLEKEVRTRAEEEEVAATVALATVAAAGGAAEAGKNLAGPTGGLGLPAGLLRPGETVVVDRAVAPPPWQRLFAGDLAVVSAAGDSAVAPPPGGLVFPGSFDPLHDGHRLMARVAEEIAERAAAYELSITNVDKPALDYLEIRSRAAQFGSGPDLVAEAPAPPHAARPLWLTRAATFLEKTEIFPKSTFIMGVDTFARLADARYYGGSRAKARDAARAIARRTRGLIVFGRERDGVFLDPASVEAPRELREVAYFVSEREFRLDVSSTQLRRTAATADP